MERCRVEGVPSFVFVDSHHENDIMYPRISKRPSHELTDRDRETLRLLYARSSGTRIRGAKRVD